MTVSIEEFLREPEERRAKLELIRGEIVDRPTARTDHDLIKSTVAETLIVSMRGFPGFKVCVEAEFHLDAGTSLIPDVSIIRRADLVGAGRDRPMRFAPVVAIEVVSSESAQRLEDKVQIYLAGGVASVWVVYPDQREVIVRRANGEARVFLAGQSLEDAALAGLALPVASLFED